MLEYAREITNKMIECASKKFDVAQAVYKSGTLVSINVFDGQISNYESSTSSGYSLGGKINSHIGHASCDLINDEMISKMVDAAYENAILKDDEDEEFIYCDKDNPILFVDNKAKDAMEIIYDNIAPIALLIEKKLKSSHESIVSVDDVVISYRQSSLLKKNSLGLDLSMNEESIFVACEIRGKQGDDTKSIAHFWYGNDLKLFEIDKFVEEAKDKLISRYNASSVPSGTYNVIMKNEAMISMLEAYFDVFSATLMQKGLSLLNGKVGEKVTSDMLSIVEKPTYDKALIKFPFDMEGVITSEKYIIKDGIFVNPLYDLKAANKENKTSTGNGFGAIRATNVTIESNEELIPYDDMIEKLENGLIITDLNGLHAGINKISGDFSLLCEGYLVKDKKIVSAVEQITISDNFFDFMNKIRYMGEDIVARPSNEGEMFCPSIFFEKIAIAGEG